jgi:hypothetical protein
MISAIPPELDCYTQTIIDTCMAAGFFASSRHRLQNMLRELFSDMFMVMPAVQKLCPLCLRAEAAAAAYKYVPVEGGGRVIFCAIVWDALVH